MKNSQLIEKLQKGLKVDVLPKLAKLVEAKDSKRKELEKLKAYKEKHEDIVDKANLETKRLHLTQKRDRLLNENRACFPEKTLA